MSAASDLLAQNAAGLKINSVGTPNNGYSGTSGVNLQAYNAALGSGQGNNYLSSYGLAPASQATGLTAQGGYTNNPAAMSGGSILGASTSTGGGGIDPHINPSTGSWDDNYYASTDAAKSAANSAQQAALSSANTQYDYYNSQLQGQLSGLDAQKQNAYNDIDTGLSGVQSQVGTSKNDAQTNADQQIQQAGSIAHSTQQQNRNVLRALGIINSTAAGDLLSKPINEFGKQRANIQQAVGQRLGELDDFMNQKTSEAQNAKNGILSQYTTLYNNIQNDLRFSDRQRLDAINAVNAQAQQHLADIQTNLLNYQNAAQQQKQQFALGLAQISAQQNPSIASNYLQQFQLSAPTNQTQTAAVYDPTQQKKNTLSGF